MPTGAICLTARNAQERKVPKGATGAQDHSGATAQTALRACVAATSRTCAVCRAAA